MAADCTAWASPCARLNAAKFQYIVCAHSVTEMTDNVLDFHHVQFTVNMHIYIYIYIYRYHCRAYHTISKQLYRILHVFYTSHSEHSTHASMEYAVVALLSLFASSAVIGKII